MLKRIVVPLDGSELSEQALNYAQDVVAPGGKLILVSVMEVPVDYEYSLVDIPLTVVTSRSYSDAEFSNAYRRVHDYLLNKARTLTKKGFDVECVVESGDPATVIAETAGTTKANAIVMTTHGRTGFSKWLFGSVTQKVIALMPCPVMVVPGTVTQKTEEPALADAVSAT